MTELTAILEKYGNAKVVFSRYYKFSFLFLGQFEGEDITLRWGESAEDIYKFEVEANKEYLVSELPITKITITKDGVEVANYAEPTSCWC